MVLPALDRAAGTRWGTPVGAGHVAPPLGYVPTRGHLRGLGEHHPARLQELRRHPGIVRRIDATLGHRDIARGRDEGCELRVRDLVTVDPEAFERDAVRRPLLGPFVVLAHDEAAAFDPHHAGGRIGGRWSGRGVGAARGNRRGKTQDKAAAGENQAQRPHGAPTRRREWSARFRCRTRRAPHSAARAWRAA